MLNKNSIKIFIKYVISGSSAAATDLLLLYILVDLFGFWYLSSSVVAYAMSFSISFVLQKFWTFSDYERYKLRKQIVQFFLVNTICLVLNSYGMFFLVSKLGVAYLAAQLTLGVLFAAFSFTINKFIIFNKSKNLIINKL